MRTLRPRQPVLVAETLTRTPGIVDVWWHRVDAPSASALFACLEILTADERDRAARFHFDRDRTLFTVSRAFLRTTLSAYADVAPADWRFAIGPHGKPHVQSPVVDPTPHFNLAHAHGAVACAVSIAHEHVGVDIERLDRTVDIEAIAARHFSSEEWAVLARMTPADRTRAFFDLWTLKESYLKARGSGLSVPLNQCAFTMGADGPAVAFDSKLNDEAVAWRFAMFDTTTDHTAAVAVDTGGAELSLRLSEAKELRNLGT